MSMRKRPITIGINTAIKYKNEANAIDFAAVSMIFPLGFGTVPTKKYDIFCLPFY